MPRVLLYNGRTVRGIIDYTLAKRSLLRRFRKGSVDRFDICDAHPELTRAARHIGEPLNRPCPVCERNALRQVRYVYGEQLGRLSGRVVYPESMVDELSRQVDEFRCYAVEVCLECGWNHLAASYLLGKGHPSLADSGNSNGLVSRSGPSSNGNGNGSHSAASGKVLRLRRRPEQA
ncbi:MAG: DUF5318 domain-containing protein [Actinobacteria bacterium]|nr:DUF5318 domain-containing protein [Actinomycetota bacterium]